MGAHRYIVRDPFDGSEVGCTYLDGNNVEQLAYVKKMSLTEFMEKNKDQSLRVVTEPVFDGMMEDYARSLETDPVLISEDEWWEKLEVLPPERDLGYRGWEFSCSPEKLYLDVAIWIARHKTSHYTFNASCNLSREQLFAKVQGKVVLSCQNA